MVYISMSLGGGRGVTFGGACVSGAWTCGLSDHTRALNALPGARWSQGMKPAQGQLCSGHHVIVGNTKESTHYKGKLGLQDVMKVYLSR